MVYSIIYENKTIQLKNTTQTEVNTSFNRGRKYAKNTYIVFG